MCAECIWKREEYPEARKPREYGLSISSRRTKTSQNLQNARSRAVRVHGEPLAAPERAGEAWGTHTAWCCVFPCSRRLRATSACLRHVPYPVRLQRPIPRRRWSVVTDGTHCWPQVMGSFDTILVVLGMLLQHATRPAPRTGSSALESVRRLRTRKGHRMLGSPTRWRRFTRSQNGEVPPY